MNACQGLMLEMSRVNLYFNPMAPEWTGHKFRGRSMAPAATSPDAVHSDSRYDTWTAKIKACCRSTVVEIRTVKVNG